MRIQRVRYEHFGGIISTRDPVGLYWVDREYLRARGFDGGARWKGNAPGHLTGPVEMEIEITEQCNLVCPCCYSQARREGEHVTFERVLAALDVARRLGAFHVAFGGGEPLLHPQLLKLGEAAMAKGLLVATTTNGLLVTKEWARAAAPHFSRINVSIDVPGGGRDTAVSLADSLRAVTLLSEAGATSGINLVLTSGNYPNLESAFADGVAAGADSLLVLRPKPGGRAAQWYDDMRLTSEQLSALVPRLMELQERHGLPFHLDCALAPVLLAAEQTVDSLQLLGALGCIAGRLLLTVSVQGTVHACSHLRSSLGRLEDFPDAWEHAPAMARLRGIAGQLQGSCAACVVKNLCWGGCWAIKEHLHLPLVMPDPHVDCHRLAPKGGSYGRRLDLGDIAPP